MVVSWHYSIIFFLSIYYSVTVASYVWAIHFKPILFAVLKGGYYFIRAIICILGIINRSYPNAAYFILLINDNTAHRLFI